jgi:putative NIF3 family GTP cyclohydrolase 1 type 2
MKSAFQTSDLRGVARSDGPVHRIAVACGSGGSLLAAALEHECDVFVTGEANFHTCIECRTRGIGLVLLGHYRSERFGIEQLAQILSDQFSDLTIWPSRCESDPLTEF